MTELSKADRAQWVREAQDDILADYEPKLSRRILALDAALTAKDEALTRVLNAAKVLVAGADRRVLAATEHEPAARAAIATLDSEREMNAKLTEELEQAQAESARLTAQVNAMRNEVAQNEAHLATASRAQADLVDVLGRERERASEWLVALGRWRQKAEAAEAQVARLTELVTKWRAVVATDAIDALNQEIDKALKDTP